MKIRTKLLLAFAVLVFFLGLVGFVGMREIGIINRRSADTFESKVIPLESLENVKARYAQLRLSQTVLMVRGAYGDFEAMELANVVNHDNLASLRQAIDNHLAIITAVDTPQSEIDTMNDFLTGINNVYYPNMVELYDCAVANDLPEMLRINTSLAKYADGLTQLLDTMFQYNMTEVSKNTDAITEIAERAFVSMLTFCVLAVIIASVLAVAIGRSMSRSITALGSAAKEIAQGNLRLSLVSTSNDELGELTRDLSVVVQTLKSLTSDLNYMSICHEEKGEIDVFIPESRYKGVYHDVAKRINSMAQGHINTQKNAMECFSEIARGNFEAPMEILPGKKRFINDITENMRKKIKDIDREIVDMLSQAQEGNLSVKAHDNEYRGDWGVLMEEINSLLDAFVVPINEASSVLNEISKGNFEARVTGDYKGDLALIKDSVNNTAMEISSYIYDKLEAERAAHESELAKCSAEAASNTRMRFLANMSHEIRTPMNGIIGMTDLAIDDPSISEETMGYLQMIKRSADGLLSIINDILDFSKIESGEMKMERIPFDLHAVFAECESITLRKAEESGIMLYFYHEPELTRKLIGDPTKLRQALLNLLSNAIKFTKRGYVSLMAKYKQISEEDEKVLIEFEVKDNGIGMSEEQCVSVFEPFKQADESTTRQYGGTGLGLSITKNIIETMGGELRVESALHVGTKFYFSLEFELSDERVNLEKTPEKFEKSIVQPRFEGTVLLCEDNPTNQQVAAANFQKLGLKMVIVDNGRQGVEFAREREALHQPFDVIFMDVHMPVMDGFQATEQLLAMGVKSPIIAMTANAMPEDKKKCLSVGMIDYISKPFKAPALWACLLRHLVPLHTEAGETAVPAASPALSGSEPSPVLNQQAGIEHSAGSEPLYHKLLLEFAGEQPKNYQRLVDAIADRDYKQAHVMAHTTKSVAATIGALRLADVLSALEKSLKGGECHKDMLAVYQQELDEVLAQIVTLGLAPKKHAKKHIKVPQTSEGMEQRAALIEELKPFLISGETVREELMERAREVFSDVPEQCELLITQIGDYEFDDALLILQEIEDIYYNEFK